MTFRFTSQFSESHGQLTLPHNSAPRISTNYFSLSCSLLHAGLSTCLCRPDINKIDLSCGIIVRTAVTTEWQKSWNVPAHFCQCRQIGAAMLAEEPNHWLTFITSAITLVMPVLLLFATVTISLTELDWFTHCALMCQLGVVFSAGTVWFEPVTWVASRDSGCMIH